MFIQLQSVTFRNFLSYGNKTTTFNLERGIHLITGTNGQGKSVILDVLSFALFGQPYRKIKMAELVNRRNQKGLFTEVTFKVDGDQYKIERGLLPNKLEVYKNDNKLELLSSKKLTQTEIDKILGTNIDLFRQVIALAISYNKPFLSLSAGDKRDIVESIFGIKIFGEMHKLLKKNSAGLKTRIEVSKKSLELMENTITGINKQIKDMKIAQRDFDANKKRDKKVLTERIDKIKADNLSRQTDIWKYNQDIEKITITDESVALLKKQHTDFRKRVDSASFILRDLRKDIKLLNENYTCPSCRSVITPEHKEKELTAINEKILLHEKDKAEYSLHLKDIEKEIVDAEKLLKTKKDAQESIISLTDKNNFFNEQIEQNEHGIIDIDNRTLKFDIDELKESLKNKSDDYVKIYSDYKTQLQDSKINDTVSMILSEEGVKAYFFKKLIPVLNVKVNEVLNKFDLPLQIRFNELMDEEIHNYTNGNRAVNYFSLSEGEKKRIDMAILLAFINVTKLVNNWNCNLIIMDELLDSSVDGAGLEKMLECLKAYMFDSKNQSCIYLISHREMDALNFKQVYQVKKSNGFSEISLITT